MFISGIANLMISKKLDLRTVTTFEKENYVPFNLFCCYSFISFIINTFHTPFILNLQRISIKLTVQYCILSKWSFKFTQLHKFCCLRLFFFFFCIICYPFSPVFKRVVCSRCILKETFNILRWPWMFGWFNYLLLSGFPFFLPLNTKFIFILSSGYPYFLALRSSCRSVPCCSHCLSDMSFVNPGSFFFFFANITFMGKYDLKILLLSWSGVVKTHSQPVRGHVWRWSLVLLKH